VTTPKNSDSDQSSDPQSTPGSWTPFGSWQQTVKLGHSAIPLRFQLDLPSDLSAFTLSPETQFLIHSLVQAQLLKLREYMEGLESDLNFLINTSTSASADSPDNPSSDKSLWADYVNQQSAPITYESLKDAFKKLKEIEFPIQSPPEPDDWRKLAEKDLDYITEQLNDPNFTQRFIQIAKSAPKTYAGPMPEGPLMPAEASFHVIEFHRMLIPIRDGSQHWIDIAYDPETHEPVVIVTHEGNFQHWYEEKVKGAAKKNA
jgi:hypothetical protein